MREQLRRFTDFDTMPPALLDAVAAEARRLRVPARRWLVRPGRSLRGHFYLLDGRVHLVEDGRSVIVNAGSARARRRIYPGPTGVETLTAALFVNVVPAVVESAGLDERSTCLGVPEVSDAAESSWQRRFLTSPLMQRLDPLAWQRILRAMSSAHFDAGDAVIRAGDDADCCFVLCSGSAEIRDGAGQYLATLAPGSLFGEDALVSGGVRNASVIMRAAGSVVSLSAERFQAWLLDAVVRPISDLDGRRPIGLSPGCGAGLCIPLTAVRSASGRLSRWERYAIVGGTRRERVLAAFLLAEQGIEAAPVHPSPCDPPDVTPAPCAPAPSA